MSNAFIAWKFNNSKWNKYINMNYKLKENWRNKLDSNHVIIHSVCVSLYLPCIRAMADNLMRWRPTSESPTILQYTFRSQFVVNHNIFISFSSLSSSLAWYDSYGIVINLSCFLILFISFTYFYSYSYGAFFLSFFFPNDESQIIWLRRFCHRTSECITFRPLNQANILEYFIAISIRRPRRSCRAQQT